MNPEEEFVVPLQAQELAEERGDAIPNTRLLPTALQDAVRDYNSKGIDFIFDHFDTFFSIVVNWNKLEWPIINKGFEYIERSCQQLSVHLEEVFQDKELESSTRMRSLNSLKMLLYLLTEIMKVKDKKLSEEMAASLSLGKRGRKGNNNDNQASEIEWRESERRAALDVVYNLLQLPLQRLWDPPLADDAFVDMVAQPCYRMMEDVIIKSKTTRETVFQILGILNKKYNHGLSCTIKLVQMVQLYEHAVLPICTGIHQLVTVWSLTGLVARLVRELGEALGGSSNGGDGEGVNFGTGDSAPAQRNCAQFLSELTQLMPNHMIPAAQAMRSYLENDECYPLRSSVLGMLCEILCKELKGEGLSEEKRIMRDEFLDDLEEHMHDLSAYVRSKTLQFWGRLQREGCVPITRLQRVLSRAIGRLQDRATLVRKSAVQLVKLFLEHNPFSAHLKLAILEQQLASEKKNLDELQKKLSVEPNPELTKKWEEVESELKIVIEETITQPSQNILTQPEGSVDTSPEAIRKLIFDKKYSEAIFLIRYTEKQYPMAKTLRKDMAENDQVSYFINLLRYVFLTDNVINDKENEPEKLELIKQFEEKENVVAFLEDSVSFSQLIQQAVPLIYTLLMSKQATDVNEAIDFFTTAYEFNIETAKLGTMGMLQLVWSPDQEKRDAVESAYRHIYFKNEGNSERVQSAATAQALVKLVQSINRGQAAALQALLARWLQAGHISNTLIQVLWEMFTLKHANTSKDDSYAALSLLVMLSKAKPSVAYANIEVIQNVGLSGSYRIKILSAQLLLSMGQMQQRHPVSNPMLKTLFDSLIDTFFNSEKFAAFGTIAINVIYAMCETPDLFCIQLLSNITEKINGKTNENEESDVASYPVKYICRLLVLLGHIALQQLIYLDVTVYGELRRRNEVREQRKQAGAKNNVQIAGKKNSKQGENTTLNCSSASAAGRLLRIQNQSTLSVQGDGDENDEMGLEGAVADDADAELVRAVCEREVVCTGILSHATTILHGILQGSTTQLSQELRASACLTLGRYMLVSSTFCEENMQLLMTLLKNASCSTMRSNIVITLADLTLRFPNIIQPWTHYIYERLDDPCVEVRQCTVKMLSYLILQEMVRVRGQVASLARCCVDSDPSTRTMARLFFKQLSQKGNALYNVIPDIISRLSDPSLALPEDHFRTILKYVMSLIQKDRQMEALVEKLCLRFKLSSDERQWRDLAYCLSLFPYNDRSIKKLIENMDCYKDKLFNKEVYNCFKIIINNTNKMAKADLKAAVSELSDKIEENFAIREPGDDPAEEEINKEKAPPTPKPRKPAGNRRARARQLSSDESDNDAESDSENVTPAKNKKNANSGTRTPARKRAPLKYRDNNSDDSDHEDFAEQKTPQKKEVFKKPIGRVVRKRK